MLNIHFIRHGKRDNSIVGDPSLTEIGRAEAVALSEEFLHLRPIAIFTSPLARARHTAEIIGDVLNLRVEEDVRLRERMNWGDLEGQSFEDFAAEWERCSRDREYQPAAGDSSVGAGRRIEDFIADHGSRLDSGSILAVTHGGVLADFLLNAFSFDELERVRPGFSADPYNGLIMRECSVTTVRFSKRRWQLASLGRVSSRLTG